MFNIALIILALYAFSLSGETGLRAISIVNAIVAVWGNGVMLNFGRHNADQIPDTAAGASIVTTVVSIGLIVAAFA